MKKDLVVKDKVTRAFEKLHQKGLHGLPQPSAFDTITSLLSEAFGNIKPSSNLLVLDVGSAAGFRTRRYFKHFNLILLDASREALRKAEEDQVSIKGGQGKVDYLQANYFNLPFEDNSIDLIVANGINEHYLDPKRQSLFEEMYRVLKNGGRMAVIVPNKLNLFHTLWKTYSQLKNTWPYGPQYDFTPMELQWRMKNLSFKRIKWHGVGAFSSWIRLFPREKQNGLVKNPTPFQYLNQLIFRLDSQTSSSINRNFGREIMVVGYK